MAVTQRSGRCSASGEGKGAVDEIETSRSNSAPTCALKTDPANDVDNGNIQVHG